MAPHQDFNPGFFAKLVGRLRLPWPKNDLEVAGLAQERRVLQSAVERKRRNDRVRNAELDELRSVIHVNRHKFPPTSPVSQSYLLDEYPELHLSEPGPETRLTQTMMPSDKQEALDYIDQVEQHIERQMAARRARMRQAQESRPK